MDKDEIDSLGEHEEDLDAFVEKQDAHDQRVSLLTGHARSSKTGHAPSEKAVTEVAGNGSILERRESDTTKEA